MRSTARTRRKPRTRKSPISSPKPISRAASALKELPPPTPGEPLKGYLPEELPPILGQWGEAPFRARQLFHWWHRHGALSWEEMANLKRDFRSRLAEITPVAVLRVMDQRRAADGAIKFVLQAGDQRLVEAVYLPEEDRRTLCLSTQIGCAAGCRFCFTGTLGLIRHLNAAEIVEQVYQIERLLAPVKVTNLVFMGMGEPLLNFDAVVRAARLLLHAEGRNFSRRHVTISTAGIAPEILRLAEFTPVNLAVSLNATTNEQRNALMPINQRYPLEQVLAACRAFPLPPGRRITFEYVLLDGVNDAAADARRLTRLLRGIPCKINLMAYNEAPGLSFRRPTAAAIERFQQIVRDAGFSVFLRQSRGLDAAAACGLLGGESCPRQPTAG